MGHRCSKGTAAHSYSNDEDTHTSSSKAKSASFSYLPPEMMVDILSRLPVKTLIRSTSVNKSWYSLIMNTKFFAAQIHRSSSCYDENAVLIIPSKLSTQHPCALFSVDKCEVIESFQVPFTTKTGTVKLVGSHNGLLCLTDITLDHKCRDLYLWNPSVRRYKTIVSSCFMDVVANSKPGHCVVGLGFHKPTNDFRVVRMVYPYDIGGNKLPVKVEIFSLRNNTWRKLDNPIIPLLAKQGGVFADGRVYWLEANQAEVGMEEMWMLSFDFGTEVFGELKLPDKVCHSLGHGENAYISLMKVEGSVAVCVFVIDDSMNQVSRPRPYSIWVMSHENGVVSWTRHFGGLLEGLGWPLQITKSGRLIMESWREVPDCDLVSCDLKNMHYMNLGFTGPTNTEDAHNIECAFTMTLGGPSNVDTPFIESLVLLEAGDAPLRHLM